MNANVFTSRHSDLNRKVDVINEADGVAYSMSAKEALAQLASTGTINNTFYTSAEIQLDTVLQNAAKCDVEFIGKLAIYSRSQAFMKDMPAILLAHLATRGNNGIRVLKAVFPRVIDNGKMLRNFVQVIRSGKLGRKSLGSAPKKLIQRWLNSRENFDLFKDSIGNDPSLADVIKMVHTKPNSDSKSAIFNYLIGKEGYNIDLLS